MIRFRWSHQIRVPMMGLLLKEETPESLLSHCFTHTHTHTHTHTQRALWTYTKKVDVCKPRRELSLEFNHAGTLVSHFQPLELWENTFLLLKNGLSILVESKLAKTHFLPEGLLFLIWTVLDLKNLKLKYSWEAIKKRMVTYQQCTLVELCNDGIIIGWWNRNLLDILFAVYWKWLILIIMMQS